MYMRFFIREIFIEHFTSINFARYRTIRRITENIDRKLEEYRRLQNKLRQEKINKEIEDIVLSHMAEEEKRERDFPERGFTLRVDAGFPQEDIPVLVKRLKKLGILIREVERGELIGGVRILGQGYVWDLSVAGRLRAFRRTVRKNLWKRVGR
jgi:F-type H+-transporting ATPase subunit gamma